MRNKLFRDIVEQTPKEVEIFVKWYAEILLRINELMDTKGINQRALAQHLGKQPSEIHKWLNGDHNFTLRSLAKLQAELGDAIIEVPLKKSMATYKTVLKGNVFKVYSSIKTINTKNEKWSKATTHKIDLANVG